MTTTLVPAKPRRRSTTYWVNGLVILAGLLEIVRDSGQLLPETAAWVGVALGAANLILRELTKQPVGKPGELVPVEGAQPE